MRVGVRSFGELLITFGLIILLFAAYEVYGKSFQAAQEQNRLDDVLAQEWGGNTDPTVTGGGTKAAGTDTPLPGNAMSRLYIPRLNKKWVVVEGVDPADIKNAPGHYPDSALPGRVGNFSIAGHRMPSIFWDLDKMEDGDMIVVETKTGWFVYQVRKVHIIKPTQVEVVAPNPENPGAKAAEPLLTITTCNPKWDNYERLVVQAKMVRQMKKEDGRPAELGSL